MRISSGSNRQFHPGDRVRINAESPVGAHQMGSVEAVNPDGTYTVSWPGNIWDEFRSEYLDLDL